MKNSTIASLIVLAILAPSCGSGGGGGGGGKRGIVAPRWAETYRTPTSVDLRAVRFGNPNSGIAAGKFGTFVRSDNGGDTWYSLESSPVQQYGDILALHVSNTTTFAVGGTPVGGPYTGGMAWQSTDATTFLQADSPPGTFGEAWVDFVLTTAASNNSAAATLRLRPDGLLDQCQGSVLVTRDSAHNVSLPNAAWTTAYGVSLIDVNTWVVCGELGGVGQIRRTQDAGLDFDSPALPTVPASPKPLRRIGMLSAAQGFAVGDNGTILTVDPLVSPAGNGWKYLPGNPIAVTLRAMHFLDGDNGWVAGDQGKIYRIRNASTATPIYEAMTTGTTEDLYDISFVDPDHGFAVGNNGIVLKTSNGTTTIGLPTWTIKSGPGVNPTPVFNAVDFSASGSVGLAVGNGGTLVRSLDGGRTWSSFNTGPGPAPLAANLTAVSIPRTGTNTVAFLGTDTGLVYYNTDVAGTGAWQLANSNNYPSTVIRTILFPKGDTAGILAGNGGNFAHLTFTPAVVAPPTPASLAVATQVLAPSPGAGILYSAACDPAGNTLYLGGASGYLVTSGDGGGTWAAVTGTGTPPAGSIRALQAPTGANFTLFAGVDDDKVYSLSKTGAWASAAILGFGTPSGMAFINDLQGWVVTQGVNGGIRFTFDGGAGWSASVPHVPTDSPAHALNAIWMSPAQTGVIVGANGLIMRTGTGGQ